MKENDDEQTTVNDLLLLMQEHLKYSSNEAFTSKWLKNRLTEHFKDEIGFTEINGKQKVVTLRSKAKTFVMTFTKAVNHLMKKLKKLTSLRLLQKSAEKTKSRNVIVRQQLIHQLKIWSHAHAAKNLFLHHFDYS